MMRFAATRRETITLSLAAASLFTVPGAVRGKAPVVTRPVETSSGKVRGRRIGGIANFLGIPYGDDTTKRRFQPATPSEPWSGVRDCIALGHQAPQMDRSPGPA
ncbi:MAG: hypothetical protein NVS3B27_11040 [Novosphingobium sp.]